MVQLCKYGSLFTVIGDMNTEREKDLGDRKGRPYPARACYPLVELVDGRSKESL